MFSKGIPVAISRHIGDRLVGRKDGFSSAVRAAYGERQRLEFAGEDTTRAMQVEKLRKLLAHAQAHCPYYTDLFSRTGFDPAALRSPDDLRALPVLAKEELLTHRDQMVSRAHRREDLNLNSTGGSTGTTVNFFQDRQWLIHQVASAQFFDSWAGWQRGCRMAYLWGAPTDNEKAAAGWTARLKSVLQNTQTFDSFNMSNDQMAQYHRQLEAFRPQVMLCYAGSAYTFARYLLEQGVRPNYPVTSLITSAETLTDEMRSTIERAFGKPVFNRYGSREVGLIGSECERHEGLHVNELDLVLEVDTSRNDQGELLVTNLNNFGMPLIRYRIGDVGELDLTPCACGRGSLRIRRLLGRSSDFFSTASGRKIHGEYFTHLFYGLDAVKRFQFVQETLETFELKLVRDASRWSDGDEAYLRRELEKVFGGGMQLQIRFVDDIPATASGKYRFTISKVA